MTISQRIGLALLMALALPAAPRAQESALTVPRNLQQLTERAAHIVRGNVISAVVERHQELGLPVLAVTLHVRETLKGEHRQRFVFHQYLWDYRDRANAAHYRKGDDVLLLMIAPSQYGLSSPAGMEQGRFRILRDGLGRELAVNGHGNSRLFDDLDSHVGKAGVVLSAASARMVVDRPRGPVAADDLSQLIRELVAAGR